MASQSTPASRAKKAKKAAPPPEDPILSGRMVWAVALALGLVVIPLSPLGSPITKKSPKSAQREQWKVGETQTIHLTVTTADFDKLACVGEKPAEGGAHCAFKDERERFPEAEGAPVDDNRKNVLQPYRTTDNQLVLLNGLWAQPEVATRLHDEPARGVAEKKLARFVVACEVDFLEEWDNPLIRWTPREAWSRQGKAMIARPKSCKILKDSQS